MQHRSGLSDHDPRRHGTDRGLQHQQRRGGALVVHRGLERVHRGGEVRRPEVAEARRIAAGAGGPIRAAPHVRRAMQDLASQGAPSFGSHRVLVTPARASNAFVCNETHALGLLAGRRAAAEDREAPVVWFVHVPTADDDELEQLAVAIRELLSWIVGVTRRSSVSG